MLKETNPWLCVL